MTKKLLLATVVALLLGVGLLAYRELPYLTQPKFVVTNQTSVAVQVGAHWREKHKSLGELAPGAEVSFSLNDEVAMTFTAKFPDGLVVTSTPPVYFTSGVVTQAAIKEFAIEVSARL